MSAGINKFSAPDDHLSARPDRAVFSSRFGRVDRARSYPTVRARIVSGAGVKLNIVGSSAPDDHLSAGPDHAVIETTRGRIGDAGCGPGIIGASVPSVRY